jgi:hypothetical protein
VLLLLILLPVDTTTTVSLCGERQRIVEKRERGLLLLALLFNSLSIGFERELRLVSVKWFDKMLVWFFMSFSR